MINMQKISGMFIQQIVITNHVILVCLFNEHLMPEEHYVLSEVQ